MRVCGQHTHTYTAHTLKLRLDILLISGEITLHPVSNTYFMYFSCIIHTPKSFKIRAHTHASIHSQNRNSQRKTTSQGKLK